MWAQGYTRSWELLGILALWSITILSQGPGSSSKHFWGEEWGKATTRRLVLTMSH